VHVDPIFGTNCHLVSNVWSIQIRIFQKQYFISMSNWCSNYFNVLLFN